jgi:dihydroorotate dehydrogenase
MFKLLRRILFLLEPEQAHSLALGMLRIAWGVPLSRWLLERAYRGPDRQVEVFGLRFKNPVGLAAGYDKDGRGWRALSLLGFGHIEVGTVTPQPQPGNPPPRIFRLVREQALINRMGFPSQGEAYLTQQLTKTRPKGVVVGVNIGKNRDTPLEKAFQDYKTLLQNLAPLADYITVNVSSPNTEGLRQLQARYALNELLKVLAEERRRQVISVQRSIPILVKLSPDLQDNELDDALEAISANGMDGVIATNTTIRREGLVSGGASPEAGGLSGKPLHEISLEMVRKIVHRTGGKLPVVGVGGIVCETGAQAMLDAGAVLFQLYTGLVYEGPGLVKRILTRL